MDTLVAKKFEAIGARAVIAHPRAQQTRIIRLDVRIDREGEYFEIEVNPDRASLEVIDVQPQMRHLLLMSRSASDGAKEKFLCGHDERHWFVAAVPPGSASNVATAIEALKPVEVRSEQARRRVSGNRRLRRRTDAYIRQGEWFFVPAGDVMPASVPILRNEPIRRGGGKAHIVDFVYRTGGETVYVSPDFPQGLTEMEYRALLLRRPAAKKLRWTVMRRNAGVYAKGRVRHPDHQTIVLNTWHRVLMNTENEAPAMRHVAFLD